MTEQTPTVKEELEAVFIKLGIGNAYIEDSKTTRISRGLAETQDDLLEVNFNLLGRADEFYAKVIPALQEAGFCTIGLHLTDHEGKTNATFRVDKR